MPTRAWQELALDFFTAKECATFLVIVVYYSRFITCRSKNIRLVRTFPYWKQMNGLVNRQNQGILRTLRIAKVLKQDWRKALAEYVYICNTTPRSVTGKSSMELLTGRPVTTTGDLLSTYGSLLES
uniref:Integrase catalytic domain-containing protein n=1 Tax=Anopheles stephensi TaxID=30069 RepID=A0A182YQ76_ANOST